VQFTHAPKETQLLGVLALAKIRETLAASTMKKS
jgi:hypothetical protein